MVALWWIGNVIFVLVIIPVVVVLLWRLMNAIFNIGKHVDTIYRQVEGLVVAVDDVKQLVPTRKAVNQVGAGLTRYVKAVDRVL